MMVMSPGLLWEKQFTAMPMRALWPLSASRPASIVREVTPGTTVPERVILREEFSLLIEVSFCCCPGTDDTED